METFEIIFVIKKIMIFDQFIIFSVKKEKKKNIIIIVIPREC